MKKAKAYIWLKTIGLLSAIIVMLIGSSSCKSRRHQTKYGPPSDYLDYDEPVTKYGAPTDYEEVEIEIEIEEIPETDTSSNPANRG